MAKEADEMQRHAGKGISASEQEQNDFRVQPDDASEKEKEQDEDAGLFTTPRKVLKTVKANGAGHEPAERDRENEPRDGPMPIRYRTFVKTAERATLVKTVHDGSNYAGGSRCWHADEIL